MLMNKNNRMLHFTATALLLAMAIMIPMTFPRYEIPPASYTLASHVPIVIAMFISPTSAVAVSVGAATGFFFGGFHITVVMRAASHLVFAAIGAIWLDGKSIPQSGKRFAAFSVVLSVVHILCEIFVLLPLYFGGQMTEKVYESDFFYFIVLLVGAGGFIHSMIDFFIAAAIWRPLSKTTVVRKLKG